jgi:preprotein translocase subunit SecG
MLGPLMFLTNATIDVLLVVYVLDCIFMGLVIMMQRSKQEGLGAAFGGGITESMWGAQTSQVLVKATVWAAIIFFALSILLARLYSNRNLMLEKGSPVQQQLSKAMATPTNSSGNPVVPTSTPMTPASTPTPPTASPQAPTKTPAPVTAPTGK